MGVTRSVKALGIDPRAILNASRGLAAYRANRQEFLRQAAGNTTWEVGEAYPCLTDRFDQSGVAEGQYFHQDLLVAQQIFSAQPGHHVDVGSRVDGFVAHVATFMPIEILDIRDLSTTASNITFTQRDLMIPDERFDNYTDSLSCLHTLEHFGLGRYGDPIDYNGYLKGWDSLIRMVRPRGTFYFSVPVSRRQRVEFDAHRMFGIPHLLELIDPTFDVEAVSLVNDEQNLVRDPDIRSAEGGRTFDVENGCIIFTLRKRSESGTS